MHPSHMACLIGLRHVTGRLIHLFAVTLLALSCASLAQTLTPLANQPPDYIDLTFQLTDGTVLAQGYFFYDWWKLTPDINGSYVNGTWTQVASLPTSYAPYAFASVVLADGRVIVEGGEYSGPAENFTLTNRGAIYDPVSNTWTKVNAPAGWDYIGDSPSLVLPNGNYLLGQKLTKRMSALDPKTLQWTEVSSTGKSDFNAEEGWTLLPNGTILTNDVKNAPNSEIYNPASGEWTSAGSTIVDLHSPTDVVGCIPFGPHGSNCYYPPGEIGPQILRPDGTVFATGSYSNNDFFSPGHTAIYDSHSGTWTVGPDFPAEDNAGDSFAALLTSGNVLVEGANTGNGYEFDGTNFTLTTPTYVYLGSLMVLPTGEVLTGGPPTETYTSVGTYQASWAPAIVAYPQIACRGTTYRIWGTQFNGLSQAAAFGDELQTATNYPLVRITNDKTNHVFYARTHDHSSMGVATGTTIVWTNFDVPATMETGSSSLQVVANGVPSVAASITVAAQGSFGCPWLQ